MTYPISSTPGVFVDHEALEHLTQKCTEPGTRAILVGFGEYAKHLINRNPENIVAVYDPSPLYKGKGVRFRGIPVIDLPERVDGNIIIACEYKYVYEYLGMVIRHYDWMRYYYPPRINYKQTAEINVFEQEEIYRVVLRNMEDAPISMMNTEKLKFMLELLRTGLSNSKTGSVLEMGSWQGGSAWFIAKALKFLGETRKFYMMDLFEAHMMDPTATMCTDEITVRMSEVYDNVEMIGGLVDDAACLARVQTPLCFAHVDLGYQETGIKFVWNNMIRGAPLLLDNYGHLGATTWQFDDLFKEWGARVIRLPWSEQGLVFKS